jgi:hypothetical protein
MAASLARERGMKERDKRAKGLLRVTAQANCNAL